MEVGVRLVGLVLRLLNFLLTPIFWLRARNKQRLPPIRNPILLRTVTDLAAAIRDGELTSEDVVKAYIERIQEVNPFINAVVDERYRAALEDAKAVDRDIAAATADGTLEQLVRNRPLLGVPFTVKESCSLAGLSNAVGCLEFAGRRATKDGEAVRLMKVAGAIPLLVSNTPELCLGWETTNLLKGTTNNPYDLNRTPGGSSGGEGALVASGASPMSVASDIAGSIRVPAAFCGLFGHKPTPGIIPIEGHIPTLTDENYPRFLTVGPMTRWAADLPLLLGVLAGDHCGRLRLDEPVDMSTLKVVYMTEASQSPALLPVDGAIKEAIERAVRYLRDECGAQVSEEKFPELDESVEMSIALFFAMKDIPNMLQDPADPKRSLSLWGQAARALWGGGGGGLRSLQALAFALTHRTRVLMRARARSRYVARAAAARTRMLECLGDNGVFIYPAHSGPAHAHGAVYFRAAAVLYTMLYNVLGLPATVVPAHRAPRPPGPPRPPLALQVIAAPNQDRLCLAVARELEKGLGGWRAPS